MSIAPNLSALKGRLDRYFWSNSSTEMVYLQATLEAHFRAFDRVAVIGGLVRDFAREGRSGFRSDVDLVIDAPSDQVAELAERLHAIPNQFGGFGCHQGPWKIDFWALETTWARRHVPVHHLEDILLCTFFDWDAIAYDLWDRKLICAPNYLDRVKTDVIDINLRPNPSTQGNLLRAMRRIILWELHPGPKLRDFIDENLNEITLSFIKSKEKELYNHQVSIRWKDAEAARSELLNENRIAPKQLEMKLSVER